MCVDNNSKAQRLLLALVRLMQNPSWENSHKYFMKEELALVNWSAFMCAYLFLRVWESLTKSLSVLLNSDIL